MCLPEIVEARDAGASHGTPGHVAQGTRKVLTFWPKAAAEIAHSVVIRNFLQTVALLVHSDVASRAKDDLVVIVIVTIPAYLAVIILVLVLDHL